MTIILGIETATNNCSAALYIDGAIDMQCDVAPRQHTKLILPMIDQLFMHRQLPKGAVDAIAFSSGPGSFMGVRLAISIAQGLAFGLDIPVIPVSTLQVLAQRAYQKTQATQILSAWDARMQEIYCGQYCVDSEGWTRVVGADALQKPAEFCAPKAGEWLAVGNAWEVYRAEIPAENVRNVQFMTELFYPNAATLVEIAANEYAAGRVQSPETAVPNYVRDDVAHKPASS